MTHETATVHRAAGEVALTEQFDNHDGYRPAGSTALAGTRLRLVPADGEPAVEVGFGADGTMAWEHVGGARPAGRAPYEALAVRDGVVAVVSRLAERRSALAVVDLDGGRAIAALTELLDGPDGTVVERTRYPQAGIGGPLRAPFEPTTELVGKRVLWRYSTTHAFEHIYLNPTSYCWHGVAGPEQWIGDVDPCTTYRIDDELYLFAWSETVVPFNGAVLIDLRARRSMGRFFGWDTVRREAGQIVVGAHGTLLNETSHAGL